VSSFCEIEMIVAFGWPRRIGGTAFARYSLRPGASQHS
jgi:hypothetical protein